MTKAQRIRDLEEKLQDERDRRYAEVNVEKEKALKIKETADLAALQLAREIQTYKDEKANELREQINSERGLYATQSDMKMLEEKLVATIRPLADYVSADRGRATGSTAVWAALVAIITIIILLVGLYAAFR